MLAQEGKEVQSLEVAEHSPGTHRKTSPVEMGPNADGNSYFCLGVHDLLVL